MKKTVEVKTKTNHRKIQKKLYHLNLKFLKSKEKVAYYYYDINHDITFSFNENICFYSASAIKVLVCLYLFKQASMNYIDLDGKIWISKEDLRPGTGIIKNQKEDTEYTIRDLIKYTLTESDNTSYIKLVNYVTKEKLMEFGESLGALHTLEGKDLFGITNCYDMDKYWKEVYRFIKEDSLGEEFKSYLENPSFQIIDLDKPFYRKYGSFGIAYHECGFVEDENPFLLFILTQKNELKNKKKFVNKAAKKIYQIHQLVQSMVDDKQNKK